jgi:Spy/CpxP family protein refolding chaperone
MKKLVVIALMLFSGLTTFAQEKKEGKPGKPDGEKWSVEQKVAEKVKRIATDLNLNEKQVAEIKELLQKEIAQKEEKRAKIKAIREEMRPTKEERESMKAEMKRILTPEQFEKFVTIQKEKKNKLKEEFKERKEKR